MKFKKAPQCMYVRITKAFTKLGMLDPQNASAIFCDMIERINTDRVITPAITFNEAMEAIRTGEYARYETIAESNYNHSKMLQKTLDARYERALKALKAKFNQGDK